MHVLQDQRKGVLPQVSAARLANGARRWIGPERLVVGAAIVVARDAEEARKRKDEERRGKRQPRRPERRFRPEPGMHASLRRSRASRRATDTDRMCSAGSETRPTSRRRRTTTTPGTGPPASPTMHRASPCVRTRAAPPPPEPSTYRLRIAITLFQSMGSIKVWPVREVRQVRQGATGATGATRCLGCDSVPQVRRGASGAHPAHQCEAGAWPQSTDRVGHDTEQIGHRRHLRSYVGPSFSSGIVAYCPS